MPWDEAGLFCMSGYSDSPPTSDAMAWRVCETQPRRGVRVEETEDSFRTLVQRG